MPDVDSITAVSARQDVAEQLLRSAGILPIVSVDSINIALRVADALQRGGLTAIELTLRTPVAIDAIAALKQEFPALVIGAGTVLRAAQVDAAQGAGADFLVTPGSSSSLLGALAHAIVPVVPGAATPSEVLVLAEHGYRIAKLFPAAALGGLRMLRALSGPFPDFMFCPTGGIDESDAAAYLALGNVACLGGSWMVPAAWLRTGDYAAVERSAAAARALVMQRDALALRT